MDSSLLLSNNARFQALTGSDNANLTGRIQTGGDPALARTTASKFPSIGCVMSDRCVRLT